MERVQATPAARAFIESLRAAHGAIYFYQSHGCCEGSTPMCFAPGEMPLGKDDCVLGDIDGVLFHASRAQCDYLQGMALTLDLAPGDSGTFSLEDGSGMHFVLRMRLWNDEETARLQPLRPSLET
jgi:uncharacterized protein